MTAEEIAQIVSLCRVRAGLKVAPDKTYLMESRLAPVARREGYDSITDLIAAIRERREEALIWATVEAMAGGEAPVVVFCTVENDLAHIREALDAGANEYIMKPFDGDIISAKFAEAGL